MHRQRHQLQHRVVRHPVQAEQQADLGRRVAEDGDDGDAADPDQDVAGPRVGQMHKAQARAVGRHQQAGDGDDGAAQDVGVQHRQDHQPRGARRAERRAEQEIPHGRHCQQRQQIQRESAEYERQPAQQRQRGGAPPQVLGLARLRLGEALILRRGVVLVAVAVGRHRRQRAAKAAQQAGHQRLGGKDGCQHDGQLPGRLQHLLARIGVVGEMHEPARNQREIGDGTDGVAKFHRQPGQMLRCADQHVGTEAVRCQRNVQRCRRRRGRRGRLGCCGCGGRRCGRRWRASCRRRRRQRLGHAFQHVDELLALGVVAQHGQHLLRLRRRQWRRFRRVCGRRQGRRGRGLRLDSRRLGKRQRCCPQQGKGEQKHAYHG